MIELALISPAEKIIQNAQNGNAIDKYIYSIALQYGLNGLEKNETEAKKVKAQALSIVKPYYLNSNGSVTKVSASELSRAIVHGVEKCIDSITSQNPERSLINYCGGRDKLKDYKEKWSLALNQEKYEIVENPTALDELVIFLLKESPDRQKLRQYMEGKNFFEMSDVYRTVEYINLLEHVLYNIDDYDCSAITVRVAERFPIDKNKITETDSLFSRSSNLLAVSFDSSGVQLCGNADRKYPKNYWDAETLGKNLLSNNWKIMKYEKNGRNLYVTVRKGEDEVFIDYYSNNLEFRTIDGVIDYEILASLNLKINSIFYYKIE